MFWGPAFDSCHGRWCKLTSKIWNYECNVNDENHCRLLENPIWFSNVIWRKKIPSLSDLAYMCNLIDSQLPSKGNWGWAINADQPTMPHVPQMNEKYLPFGK